jgi:four helix bundle protein
MAGMNYQDLKAWQRAMDLVDAIYVVTKTWPSAELYGLVSQVRRAAVSIPSNIAEGQGRRSSREFTHHLNIAHGSLREVETQLMIARRQGYLSQDSLAILLDHSSEVGRMITGLINSLANPGSKSHQPS